MKVLKAGSLAILFLLSVAIPAINVEAANNARTDTDTGYLSEKWHAGLGTGLGALNSIKSADIDQDGEDELVFGNSKGYVHILDWNSSAGGWYEDFQTVDMGGPVKGMEIAQIDDDPQLEIAIGYNWNSDAGKVKIIDGISLLAEANWSSGISWSHTQWTEGWPYGLAMGDLDGDDEVELAMSGDRGFLWVVDTETPEIYVGRDLTYDEAEWYVDIGAKTGGGTLENTWGLTFGQFDEDEAMEVAVGSKQGWVAVFDGETEEMQWKYDMDGSSGADSLCYSLLSADLDGNGIDELIVPQQNKLTVFVDGDRDVRIEDSSIKSGYGLANADLFGNTNEELVVVDGSGNIRIMGLVGSALTTYQEWSGGYSMNFGAGVTISMNGHDNPWIVHGSDSGMVVAWEVTSQSNHELAWKSDMENNANQLIYSLEGGSNYAVTMANIDDDDNLEILVGSGSGRVYAFDGETYEADWVSPVLDKIPMGIAVDDLNNDGNNEIVITTGIPSEPEGEDGLGGEGFLYVFERSGNDMVQAFKSDDIDASMGVIISELDGSTYPEIGIATGYLEIVDATSGATNLHGAVKVWGYGGSSYSQEWTSGDIGEIVGGISSGDPDGDGTNEIVIGTAGDSRDGGSGDGGEVRVYHRSGSSYSLDGSVIQPNQFDVFGIAVGDVNNDGQEEIIVGTGEFGDNKPKLLIYDGSTHSQEFSKVVDSTSVWGVATGDFDNDGEPELIYGTSGGELFIYDGIEPTSFEAKTSALSNKAGHYGGIVIGDVDNDGSMEMAVGSDSYLWLFSTEGQTNKPDLAFDGADISYLPELPDEDEDIIINLSVSNLGGSDTSKWRVLVYDGDPDAGGKKITEFECDATEPNQRSGCKALTKGESASFEVTWYGQQTSPGYHEIYGLAEDTNSPRQETRFGNNKDFTTIEIEEIPNDKPISVASVDKTVLWIDESARIDAGSSYDTETTNGNSDQDEDSSDNGNFADLQYRFYFNGDWTSWLSKFTQDISYSTPGEKEIKVMSRDERRKESDEITFSVTVKPNTQPIAILGSNISEVAEGGFVTFDVSQSYDPDYRVDLEYRFIFGDGVYSNWVVEGSLVVLYRNAFFNGPNGGELELGKGEELLRDTFGIGRVFKLTNGSELPISFGFGEGLFLLEMIDSSITSNGYNYTLSTGIEERTYGTQILVREFSEDTDDLLVSGLSSPVSIRVYKPENIEPVAVAKAGIFYGSVSGSFTDQLTGAKTGDEITYSAAESYDPDGDDLALTYEWRIVDSRGASINLLGDKYEKTFKRIYNEPGTYTAILTVTDERGGSATWQVDAVVTKSDGYGDEVEEGGYSQMTLIGAAVVGIIGLVGGSVALNRMRGGSEGEFEDMFEDITPGSLELNCPTCNGLISITTTQRPIQIGCPMCQSQFVIRE
tara:strand:- start:857 stop:5080 length:4224 start_codon:yes stop_codon:yes gene_type:complete